MLVLGEVGAVMSLEIAVHTDARKSSRPTEVVVSFPQGKELLSLPEAIAFRDTLDEAIAILQRHDNKV